MPYNHATMLPRQRCDLTACIFIIALLDKWWQNNMIWPLNCLLNAHSKNILTQYEATEAKWVWKQDSPSSSDIREGSKENSITFGDIIGATVKFQKVSFRLFLWYITLCKNIYSFGSPDQLLELSWHMISWFGTYNRVAKVVTVHDDLLTQWRPI